MLESVKKEVTEAIAKAAKLKLQEVEELIEEPKDSTLGDLALPCFRLAAKFKTAPQNIAKDIAAKIPKLKSVRMVHVTGPYVNFFLNSTNIAEEVIVDILKKKDKFGSPHIGNGEQVVLDVIGLNPNKEGHIGHVRNSCIGDSLARIYSFAGFKTSTQSFINDQGLPTTLTFYAYKYLKNKLPKRTGYLKKEDHWQGAIYAMMQELTEKDAKLKKKVEQLQHILEYLEDMKLVKEQRVLIEKCKAAQADTWNRLNTDFDLGVHESDLTNSKIVEKTLDLLKKKDAVYISKEEKTKGCLMLNLSQFDYFKGMLNPDKILVRADGRTTYTGKDVGMEFWRFNLVPDLLKYAVASKTKTHVEWSTNSLTGKKIKHNFNKNKHCIHIIGAEQKYVIAADYYALKAAGFEKEFKNNYHLASGLVGFGEEAKISSREGASGLSADEVLDKVKELALKEVKKRNPKLNSKKAEELAEKIGVSAIRYYMVRTDPTKFVKFSFEDALSFEGNTGPYLQYALVRAKKILAKAKPAKTADFSLLNSPEEGALIKKLVLLPEIVGSAVKDYNSSHVANYAFELANLFSSFYEACPVIRADAKTKAARLMLVQTFAQVLRNALNLLGIEEVEVM